jgi:hypothetical protein
VCGKPRHSGNVHELEETAMPLRYNRTRGDRRFGYVLIAVFTLGILGAALATYLNGGHVPQANAGVQLFAKTTAPV